MGFSLRDYKLTSEWVNLKTLPEYEDELDDKIGIQIKNAGKCYVVMGAEDKPEGKAGCVLINDGSIIQTADSWWVKGRGYIAIWKED